MNINTLKPLLQKRLGQKLPGDEVRRKMAPELRMPKNWNFGDMTKARVAGVLILIYPKQNTTHIAYMQRPEDGYAHSGQISFPGGGREEQDRDILHTALREAEEEFGVPQNEVEVLGQLTTMYIPVSNSMVYPVVGYLPHQPQFIPDPKEVAEIIEVPLEYLRQESIIKAKKIQASSGFAIQAPYYDLYGKTLWGATAMMTSEFLVVLEEALKNKI